MSSNLRVKTRWRCLLVGSRAQRVRVEFMTSLEGFLEDSGQLEERLEQAVASLMRRVDGVHRR
jgi:hypothetical protein